MAAKKRDKLENQTECDIYMSLYILKALHCYAGDKFLSDDFISKTVGD